MDSSEDFDDDPFNYKPLKRRKLGSPTQKPKAKTPVKPKQSSKKKSKVPNTVSQKAKQPTLHSILNKSPSPKKSPDKKTIAEKLPFATQTLRELLNSSSSKSPKSPTRFDANSTKTRKSNQTRSSITRCPVCKVPIDLLSSHWTHIVECKEGSVVFRSKCPQGIACDSKAVEHYREYDHTDIVLGCLEPRVPLQLSSSPESTAATRQLTQYLSQQTPTPRKKYISPVKVIRRDPTGSQSQRPKSQEFESANNSLDKSLAAKIQAAVEVMDVENKNESDENVDENITEFSNKNSKKMSQIFNDSPIKVTAERDSAELQLSLNIDPEVQCTKLRVRVPLKPSDTGGERDVEVSATYTDVQKPSPVKRWSPKDKENQKNAWNNFFHKAREKGAKNPPVDVRANKRKPDNFANSTEISSGGKGDDGGTTRKCPWYKKIRDTSLAVDVFNCGSVPGVSHYLLSHYHSDHYMGLSKKWSSPIVSSSITKRLATKFSRANPDLFLTCDPGESILVAGVELTAVDANHCPGSIMFIIKLTSGTTILHTGDFRACPEMESYPEFWSHRVDTVYLDTTYCRPEYDFPSQGEVIDRTVELVQEFLAERPNTAVCVGAYMIGKERIFKALARDLGCRVWCEKGRLKTWECLQDSEILENRTDSRAEARVHVIQQKLVNWGGLGQQLDQIQPAFSHILGVRPTGWTHSRGGSQEESLANLAVTTRGQISLLEVPYSEHSSFSELRRFLKFLRVSHVKQVIPTVNLRDVQKMKKTFSEWIEERKGQGPDSISVTS